MRCIVAVLAIGGCGQSTSDPVGHGGLHISPVTSTTTDAPAGATLSQALRVVVTQGGVPAGDVTVTWTAIGSGSVSPVSTLTDDAGEAGALWNVGTVPGTVRVRASVGEAEGSTEFTAVVRPGLPASLTAVGPATVGGVTGSTIEDGLRVQLRDAFGNPIQSATIAWDVVGSADVVVVNNAFQPATITVPVNALVRWRFQGTSGVAHFIAASSEPPFGSPTAAFSGDGVQFRFLFAVPGNYRYECTLHAGMAGIVVVQ